MTGHNMYEQYTSLNISVIPILPGTKKPYYDRLKAVGWHDDEGEAVWQPAIRQIADEATLQQWFGDGNASIALVGGVVSNNLIYLDWDSSMDYKKWAMAHRRAVNATAVSQTASGYHVFFRLPETESGRTLFYEGKASGQIRGEGQYVVEEPSVHPSGFKYKWLRHPAEGIMELETLQDVDIIVSAKTNLPDDFEVALVPVNDQALIIKARSSWWGGERFKRLWIGDWTGYDSRSEAHLGLCWQLAYWTGRDIQRMDRLFRRSKFFKDPETRAKWVRPSNAANDTYGMMTMTLACLSCNKVYEVSRKGDDQWTQI